MPPFAVTKESLEDISVLALVEPPHELMEVSREMFRTHMMKRPCDSALQQAPEVLDGIGMDVSIDVGDLVVDDVVRDVSAHDPIAPPFVGVEDFDRSLVNLSSSESFDFVAVEMGDLGASDSPTSFDDADDCGLLAPSSGASRPNALFFTPDVGVVHLQNTEQLGFIVCRGHGAPNTMAHIPSGGIADIEHPVNLVSAHPLLGLADEVNGDEPLP